MAIVNAPMIKHGSHAELCSFIDNLEHNLSSLTDSGQHTIEAVWTSIVAGKLSKKLEEEWLKYSDEEKNVPDIKTLVTFLKKQLQYIPKTTTVHAQPKVEVKTEPLHKLYKVPVHIRSHQGGKLILLALCVRVKDIQFIFAQATKHWIKTRDIVT